MALVLSSSMFALDHVENFLIGLPSGIFSQSNYGIVTKMGFGLMPDPGGHESFVGRSRSHWVVWY
jgi:hypothetical protein